MQNRYVPATAVADFDERVSKAADDILELGGGAGFVIGIRNESGHLYREFMPSDPAAFVTLYDELEDLGFVDELEDDADTRAQRSAIFSRPARGAQRSRRVI